MSILKQYKKILDLDNKVLNIYHKDLDGCASSIIMKNLYKNITFKDLRYGDVNEYLKALDFTKYHAVILTDISPESIDMFDLSDKIFLLDHHDSAVEYHCPEKNRIVESGRSAAKLVKNFYQSLFNIDLSYLDEMCEVVNDYDMWINDDIRGWMMNELYFKYWDEEFRRRFTNGDMRFSPEEKKYLKERKALLDCRYNELDIYELDSINGCFFFANNFINDLCHRLLKEKKFNFVVCINPKTKNCSVRINEFEEIHIGNILKEIDLGGGHKQAGGFSIKENSEVENAITKLEKHLYQYNEMRRK